MKTPQDARVGADDLERAREISRRLKGGPDPGVVATGSRFVTFRAARVGSVPAAMAPFEQEGPSTGRVPWDRFLSWTRLLTRAEAAFALDGHGLVIAVHGTLQMEELERIGARLLAALEQARKIDVTEPSMLSVNIALGDRWLSGLSVVGADGSRAVLGLLGPIVSSAEVRSALTGALSARLFASDT